MIKSFHKKNIDLKKKKKKKKIQLKIKILFFNKNIWKIKK